MPDAAQIREMVDNAVHAVLNTEAEKLRELVVQRVMAQLEGASSVGGQCAATAQLQQAFAEIEQASTQSDILQALLEGTTSFAARAAVFLVRGTSAIGWQARGFSDNDLLKSHAVDVSAGLAQQAISQGSVLYGTVAEFDGQLATSMGAPEDGKCAVAPLLVRDKAVALVYADADTGGCSVDPCALQLLMRIAGLWLEVVALRKATGAGSVSSVAPSPEVADPVAASTPAVSAPKVPDGPVDAEPQADVAAVADEETHRKARRFAKLLVEEIKLYNMAKVKDGKQHRNLYARLKDDIEKSRATYDQRYGKSPVAQADYFTEELVRGLADGDPALFGSNFPR